MNLYWNWWNKTSFDTLNIMTRGSQGKHYVISFREVSGDKHTRFENTKNIHAHSWPYKSKKELIEYLPNNMYYDKIKNFINWPIDKPNNITWTYDDITTKCKKELIPFALECKKYGFEIIRPEIENNIEQRFTNFGSRKKTWINPDKDNEDTHPNNETHIKIADYIYENL